MVKLTLQGARAGMLATALAAGAIMLTAREARADGENCYTIWATGFETGGLIKCNRCDWAGCSTFGCEDGQVGVGGICL